MDILKNVEQIEYSKTVDMANCATHTFGAVLAIIQTTMLEIKAMAYTDKVGYFSCVIYGLSLFTVYTISAIYHGVPQGKPKQIARLFDHMAVPLFFAGTCTPCALITLRKVSQVHAIWIFALAWFVALFGTISKLFFFEKMRKVVMWVYFTVGFIMIGICVPLITNNLIDKAGFLVLISGSFAYCVAALFCYLGIKRPYFHVIFHIFTLIASTLQFISIYGYVLH